MSISMAMDKPKTPPPKTKTSLFFSCFGFSKKVSLDKPFEAHLSNTHKRKRWFSWPRFRMKPSAIKTVPLVHPSCEKTTTSHCKYKKSTKSKSNLKLDESTQLSINRQSSPAARSPRQSHRPGVQDLPTPQKDSHGDTNLGNVEKLDKGDGKIDDKCLPKRLPSSRTNDKVKTALSRTSSGSDRSSRVSSLRPAVASLMISNAVSVPVAVPGRHGGNESSPQSHVALRKSCNGLAKSKKRKDPGGVGMSVIIMVILMMVILCGRLYAILCTSAWFYFLPRLRITKNGVGAKEEDSSDQLNKCTEHLELDSKDYKKKVILEGLLERNRRISQITKKDGH